MAKMLYLDFSYLDFLKIFLNPLKLFLLMPCL